MCFFARAAAGRGAEGCDVAVVTLLGWNAVPQRALIFVGADVVRKGWGAK